MLTPQSEYVKKLRPLLPPEAFQADPSKLIILGLNLGIYIAGLTIARNLNHWPIYWLWLFIPFAIVMGNSVTVFAIGSHELMHGGILKKRSIISYLIGFLGFSLWWMPLNQWQHVHNKVHHGNTNGLKDPDRNYLYEQPKTWENGCKAFLFLLQKTIYSGFYLDWERFGEGITSEIFPLFFYFLMEMQIMYPLLLPLNPKNELKLSLNCLA